MAWFKPTWFRRRRAVRASDDTPAPAHEPTNVSPSPASESAASPTTSSVASPTRAIVMYGTPWCGDCRRAKRIFAELAVDYAYVDIEHDTAAAALVMHLNQGMRSVPTILFPDGSVLVEPGRAELSAKLAAYAA